MVGTLCGQHPCLQQGTLRVMQLPLPAEGRWALATEGKPQEVVYLVIGSAEASCGVEAFHPQHWTETVLDCAMTLLQQLIGVAGRAVRDGWLKFKAQGSRVRALAIRGDAQRAPLADQAGGAEESPGRRKVTRFTEPDIHEIPFVVKCAVEVPPPSIDLNEGFVHVPPSAALPVAVLA